MSTKLKLTTVVVSTLLTLTFASTNALAEERMFLKDLLNPLLEQSSKQLPEKKANLENLMPPIEHEPSVYVDGQTVSAFGVNVITNEGTEFSKDGIELSLEDAEGKNNQSTLSEDVIKSTMTSGYQGPSIVVKNGHVFAFGVKVTAQDGSVVYAGKDAEVGALRGSTVYAMLGSRVYASEHSTVIANAGSQVQAMEKSTVTANWGSYVIGSEKSNVIAEKGSTVRAMNFSIVTAKAGSKVYAERGAAVKAEAGAEIINSDTQPYLDNLKQLR